MKIKKHTITHAIKYIFLSLLLALPFIAMLPSTFYYAFNQNAQDNTANEVITEYQTNEVNSISDIKIGNMYRYNGEGFSGILESIKYYVANYLTEENINTFFLNVYDIEFKNNDYIYNDLSPDILEYNLYIYCDTTDYSFTIYYYAKVGNINTYPIYTSIDINETNEIKCDFIATQEFIDMLSINIADNNDPEENFINAIQPSNYLGNVEVIEHDLNNQNAFYYASSQVFEKPLFNWVKNSIFVVPIMGMLGIFGISEMNFISSLLVYWVNILSIYAILNIILLVIEKLGSFGKRKNE